MKMLHSDKCRKSILFGKMNHLQKMCLIVSDYPNLEQYHPCYPPHLRN